MSRNKHSNLQNKKERITQSVGFIIDTHQIEGDLVFEINSNGVIVKDSKERIVSKGSQEMLFGYKKDNGKIKTLNKFSNGVDSMNVNKELFKFDYLFATDTNVNQIDGKFVHMGGLVQAKLEMLDEINAKIHIDEIGAFMWNEVEKIEQFEQRTWVHAINHINDMLVINDSQTIGIIVDCDLGNIKDYNNRSKPYYEDYYLPAYVEFIYASADTGVSDNISGKLIKYTDKFASRMIRAYFPRE